MKVVVAFACCGMLAVAQSAKSPQVRYRWDVQKSGVEDNLQSVCFVNRQAGWAAGKANTILKTNDGGNTWTRLMERKEGVDFHSIVFTSPTDGWAQATRGALLHTTDGGESWQPAMPLPAPAGFGGGSMLGTSRIQMHGATSGAGVFRSDDGGRSWKQIGSPRRNDYEAVFFVDDQHGWLSGGNGRLALTTDGGATWTEIEAPLKGDFRKIQFANPEAGWILPRRGHQGGLLATTDGGKTWNSQYAGIEPYRPLMDMQFLNEQTGFLLAEAKRASSVLATSNGGKTWRTIGEVAEYSTALSFPVADEGWVVGPKGYIVHYHKIAE